MKAENIFGPKKNILAALKALGISPTDKPIDLPRPVEEIVSEQYETLATNYALIDSWAGFNIIVHPELYKSYFDSIVFEFYQQIEDNYRKLDPKGVRWIEITDDSGWARFLLDGGFERFLSETRRGYKLPVGSGDNSCTLSNWVENNGFQHDIRGFIESMKAGEEYQMRGEIRWEEVFLLINFMEAVEIAEDNHKEEARKKGLVFPHPNWTPAGYDGYFVGCPLFKPLSAPMIRAGNHFFKTNKKGEG